MKNIAVMRNTETLQIYAMAPIYDNGDCMYVHGITTVTEETLLRQETSSFYKKAVDNLKLVRNREALRLELLPDCNIIDTIYADILNEEQRAMLKRIYQLIVHYLHRFQGG